jgi:SAM-dependent methyltransferase
MRSAETLQSLLDLAPAASGQRWVEVACGPGLISRALAPRAATVLGVDLTQAMLGLGRREAEQAGLDNVHFVRGDATHLPLADGRLDGALTRFSLHHIPLPGRVVEEMLRVVRPGGWVVIGDHVTASDQEAAAWHQEIERLRDPSHWACLTPDQLRALGGRAGLKLREEQLIPLAQEFEEWIQRGTGGPGARPLIERLLTERPNGCDAFHVSGEGAAATLHLRYWLSLWQRPEHGTG